MLKWFVNHKWLTAAIIAVLLLAVWEASDKFYPAQNSANLPASEQPGGSTATPSPGATGTPGAGTNNGGGGNKTATGETVATPDASASKYKMTISGSTVSLAADGTATVTGNITNNEQAQHSATVGALFYDKAGLVVGSAQGSVSDVQPGQTQAFTITSSGKIPADYAKMVVQVNSIS